MTYNKGGRQPTAGLGPRSCESCGTEFQPYRSNQTTCSRTCYRATPRAREAQKRLDARPDRRARKNEVRRLGGKWSKKTTAAARRSNLRVRGWTVEAYEAKLAEQDGKCRLCGAEPRPDGVKAASKLHADHDHVTKLPRDLLCGRCNVGVGMFRDDPALLRAAAEYIERHRAAVLREGEPSG